MNSIFLVGCPRSGTTLLQSMVASHPRIISFPETHFFSKTLPINPLLRRFKLYGPKDASPIISFLQHQEYPLLPAAEELETESYLHHSWCQKLAELLDEMANYDQNKQKLQATHWLEKTPRHLHYITSIENTRTPHKFIHILREGKHVVASLHLATRRHPDQWDGERSVRKCIRWWKKDVKKSIKYHNRPNHLLVVYEQLIREPEKVLNRICNFLPVEYNQQMATRFHQTADNLTTEEEQWKNRNTNTSLRKSNKLQEHFDDKTIAYITQKTAAIDLSPYYFD